MKNIYIRREGVPQKRTKVHKGDKGWRGWGLGMSKNDEFRAYE